MLILPAIDLIEGRCVRLHQGDYAQETRYDQDPAELAAEWGKAGIDWVHVVDLEGAKAGTPKNLDAIRRICAVTSAKVEVGGGIRSRRDADAALEAGASRVILGSALLANRGEAVRILRDLGERAVVGLDCRDGKVAIHGWTETSHEDGVELARRLAPVGARFIVTDIATDGTLQGPNLALLKRFVQEVERPVIASGGVSSLDDLRALAPLGVEGAIVGKALYEGRFTVKQALDSVRRKT